MNEYLQGKILTKFKLLTIRRSKIGQRIIALLLVHNIRHGVDVIRKRRDTQSLDHDVREVIGIEHEVLTTVAQ